MAGYYDPNIGWVEFTDDQAASLPQTPNLPWMPDPLTGISKTGVQGDPNNYEYWNNLWLDKSMPLDWSLGQARWGQNMLGMNYEQDAKNFVSSIWPKATPSNLDWGKAMLSMDGYFGQNGMEISPNTSKAYLLQELARGLGTNMGLDMNSFNSRISSPDWQNTFNTSAQEAGQQNTQYQAMNANPMPWPVALIAAATGGLMGYGALSGMGALGGGGIGGSSASGLAAADVAGGLIPEFGSIGAYDAAIGAGSSLGAGGTGAFTVPTSGLGGSEFGLLNASGASDMSFFPDVLDLADWWAQDTSAALDAGSWGDWIGQTAPSAVDYAGTMAGDQGIYGALMDAYNALPSGAQSGLSNLTNAPSSVVRGLSSLLGSDPMTINSALGSLGGLLGNGGLGSLFGGKGLLGGAVSLAPIWYGYDKGKDIIGDGFDTSRQQSLYNQFNPQAGTLEYDLNTGRGREALNAGLQRRGVTGSSFANFDNASYNTLRELGRQDLINRNVGIAGSLANSITNTDVLKAQMEMDLLGRALGASGWALGGRSLLG